LEPIFKKKEPINFFIASKKYEKEKEEEENKKKNQDQ